MIKRPISEHDQWIVDKDNLVTGIAPSGTGKETTIVTAQTNAVSGVTITTIWNGTQAEYDALTPDANTLYVIVP